MASTQELHDPLLGEYEAGDQAITAQVSIRDRDVEQQPDSSEDDGGGAGGAAEDILSPMSPNSRGEMVRWSMRSEFRAIIGVSLPIAVSTIARLAIAFTDTAFIGHLGTVCLSASSLALNWSGVLCDLM